MSTDRLGLHKKSVAGGCASFRRTWSAAEIDLKKRSVSFLFVSLPFNGVREERP
jgi:hypothetical protein